MRHVFIASATPLTLSTSVAAREAASDYVFEQGYPTATAGELVGRGAQCGPGSDGTEQQRSKQHFPYRLASIFSAGELCDAAHGKTS